MIYLAIITTIALLLLSSHDFHKPNKRKHTRNVYIKRVQLRNPKNGQWAKKLPLEIIHLRPRFRYVEERLMVRV